MRTILDLGELGPFHDQGVIDLADVHTALGLLRMSGCLDDPRGALAVALCVRALREGSVCIDIAADPAQWMTDLIDDEEGQSEGRQVLSRPPEGMRHPEGVHHLHGMNPADESIPPATTVPGLHWPEPGQWLSHLQGHPLIASREDEHDRAPRPLRLVGSLLYLWRYWEDEETIRDQLRARFRVRTDFDHDILLRALVELFPDPDSAEQRRAAATAALLGATIVAGGPGTGKTTTVARIVAVLRHCLGPSTQVALAAPTGKAAARLQEAFSQALTSMSAADAGLVGELSAATLHRLLGAANPRSSGSSGFRHDFGNPLPHDVVIVDEASMVALPLMASLLRALRPDARLILVGDPDQLTSVEVGAVLGDLVHVSGVLADPRALDGALPELLSLLGEPPPAERGQPLSAGIDPQRPDGDDRTSSINRNPQSSIDADRERLLGHGQRAPSQQPLGLDPVVTLHRNWRFGGRIAELARSILAGDMAGTLHLLRENSGNVQFLEITNPADELAAAAVVRREVLQIDSDMRQAAQSGDAVRAVAELDRHRVLCAHRTGGHGVARWNLLIAGWLSGAMASERRFSAADDEWFAGRPILVTANDYEAGVYNGDTGVTIAVDDQLRVALSRGIRPLLVPTSRLDDVQTLYAMTVHRGQGSQFEKVTIVLPPPESPILTRELLYTAITRAREGVRIVGSEASVRAALQRRARRASGLRDYPASG